MDKQFPLVCFLISNRLVDQYSLFPRTYQTVYWTNEWLNYSDMKSRKKTNFFNNRGLDIPSHFMRLSQTDQPSVIFLFFFLNEKQQFKKVEVAMNQISN